VSGLYAINYFMVLAMVAYFSHVFYTFIQNFNNTILLHFVGYSKFTCEIRLVNSSIEQGLGQCHIDISERSISVIEVFGTLITDILLIIILSSLILRNWELNHNNRGLCRPSLGGGSAVVLSTIGVMPSIDQLLTHSPHLLPQTN
jgi:hypothetical protein